MASFKRSAQAQWDGDLTKGRGQIQLGSGAYTGPYSFNSRFGDEPATNPEELIGAAHAGCFTMALSAGLTKAGKPPQHLETKADVTIAKDGEGFTITNIALHVSGIVPGISADEFQQFAKDAKAGCPVSRALTGVEISLEAQLSQTANA